MGLPDSGERFIPGRGGPGIHLEHLHRYSLAATLVGGRVLDLGCGAGYGSQLLARVARRVIGIDRLPLAVRCAQNEFPAATLDYLVGDARALPFPCAAFDWVVCFELIEHIQETEAVLSEIARVLTPDGQLLLSTPNRPLYSEARNYMNPFHLRELDTAELRALLGARFGEVVLFGQRLVAGSVMWELGRPAPARRIEAFALDAELAPELRPEEGPVYLLALCARQRRAHRASGSVLTGRLEAFIEEQAARRREAETEIRAQYESVVARLVAQLGEFDARIRQLGGEVDLHHAASSREVARLSDQLAEERLRAVSLETQRESLEVRMRDLQAKMALKDAEREALVRRDQETLVALSGDLAGERLRRQTLESEVRRLAVEQAELQRQSAALDAAAVAAGHAQQVNGLRLELEKTRLDLDWSYRHWQLRESELEALQRSRLWSVWTTYHALRRAVRLPIIRCRRAARHLARRVRHWSGLALRALARALSGLYLIVWTVGAWVNALQRDRELSLTGADREPRAPTPQPALRRRPRVLVLCPYSLHPADHGGGVRIFNLIRRLSLHCDFHLLIFIQGEDDPAQRRALEPWVEKLYFHHWRPRPRQDFWGLKPPGVQLFEAPEVRSLVNDILSRERIDILKLEYTELGQYGLPRFARVKVVLSEIDIAFRSAARRRRAGMHHRYALGRAFGYSLTDWMRQFRYELQVARRADQVQVMSFTDGAYLARFLPDGWQRIRVVPNAVDVDDYRPLDAAAGRGRYLLFVGNFEHLPNLDALDYLLSEIWPGVRHRAPNAELLVVGARAGESVHRYDGRVGVTVVGSVPETKPYYQQCRALVAPIRAGSGTRLKILEALACATPVATTTIGAEGIDGRPGEHFLIADTVAELTDGICRLLEDDELCARLGRAGRALVENLYSWQQSAAAALAGYADLLGGSTADDPDACELPVPGAVVDPGADGIDVSVVIPTLNGGAVLARCLAAVSQQQTSRSVEVICVDSGSSAADLETMERYDVRMLSVERTQFNHGLTRDLGAAASRGTVLVFLNQDAVPCNPQWLDNLVAPLFTEQGCAAVQGAIHENPDRNERFYWDSCGDRFYFTRESKRWLERYFGIGFSTVNAAIRRDVWKRHPFGYAQIMEDKKWQREIVAAGYFIAMAPLAVVYHTHDYDMNSLSRRCESEGFGWRSLGEIYSLYDMLADVLRPRMYADLVRGLVSGQIRSWAELLFPFLRPLLLFRGNRWPQGVRL